MEFRKGLILALGLLITSCNVTNSTNINIDLPNEYQDDKSFSAKLLNSGYIKNKLDNVISLSLITSQNNEAQKKIVREINFYSLEDQKNNNSYYKNLYDTIISTTPSIHSSIIAMSQVITKRSQSVIFDNFLSVSTQPVPTATPTSTPTPTPVINDFRVNTYTTGRENFPSTAMDSNGNFVVTWTGQGPDVSDYAIYGQRYRSDGIPQGLEFRVNTYTNGEQSRSSTAMDSNGNFVVTWTSSFQDDSVSGIYGQRYSSDGTPQGSEFKVNTYTTNNQNHSSVAMDSIGNFVVTWSSDYGQDGSGWGIYGQRYNSSGFPQGTEFQVNTHNASNQNYPSTAMDSNGNFVVTWQSKYQDGSDYGIYGQRYRSDGIPQGLEFKVNEFVATIQNYPSTAMDSNGNFVVIWSSYFQDGGGYGIYGQRYSSDGSSQGSEFRVNTYTTGFQRLPSTEMNSSGDFVVTWSSDGQNGAGEALYCQRYSSDGTPQGSEFRVNNYTNARNIPTSVEMDLTGNFVVVWNDYRDGNNNDIYAKRYDSNGNPI